MLVTILTHSQKFFSFNLLEVNLILNLLFSKLTGIYHSDTLLSADQILTLILVFSTCKFFHLEKMFSKLTQTFYRATLLHADYNFDIFLFKLFTV